MTLKQTTSAGTQSFPVVKSRDPWRCASLALQYAVFPVAILLLWQIGSEVGFVRRNVFPPPSEVLSVWYDLVTGSTDAAARYSGTWLDHASASAWRVFAGFSWGVALGIFVGLLIGLSRVMERVL
ncbi:MAG: ABC transporter permease, partial [Bradyrhizobium sp.]